MAIEKITIYLREPLQGPLELEIPHNPRFVRQLKQDIPAKLRKWKPKVDCTDDTHHMCSGRWLIDKSCKVQVGALLRLFYDNIEFSHPGGQHSFRRTIG